MYTASFGLRCLPFEDRADAAFFYPAAGHEEAIAAMQYEVQHGAGVGVVFGETGTGKTILIRALTRRLTGSEKVVVLTVPGNGSVDILREACKGFGISVPTSIQDARGLARLRRHLSRSVQKGSRPVLIIDQAENLSPADLNDVESLLDMQDDRGRLVRVILAAHPRFRKLLDQPAFARLRQMAFTEHELTALSEEEVGQYIRHRLSVAGAAGLEVFSDDAVAVAFDQSQGIPRVINQLCGAAMLAAYGEGSTTVDHHHFQNAADPDATVLEEIAADRADVLPPRDAYEAFETPIPPRGEVGASLTAKMAGDMESRLAASIMQAQKADNGLRQSMPQAADAMAQVESKAGQLVHDAQERIFSLESRLSAATRRAEQAITQMERAERVFARAEEIESRLAGFAERLAEQMDNVQARMADVVKYAAPLDEARTQLDASIRLGDFSCEKIEESIERGSAKLLEQSEAAHKTLQRTIASLMESSTQRVRTVQAQMDNVTRTATDKITATELKIAEVQKVVQAGEQTLDSATQKAAQTSDALQRVIEQARVETEGVSALIHAADAKITQLNSSQAALTHLHERMARMLHTAHPIVERADATLGRLEERLPQTEKARGQLVEKMSEVAAITERANQAGQRAAQEARTLQDAVQAAAQLGQKLEAIQEQASRDIVALQEYLAKSSVWLSRMESFTTTVASAGQTSEMLAGVVASGASMIREIPLLLDKAKQQEILLDEKSKAMSGYFELHEKACRASKEASESMNAHLQNFRGSLHQSEGELAEYNRRVGALQSEFEDVTRRTDAAQKIALEVQGVVENARNQSENLERVCEAVQKVFSGLSKASLNAKNQAGDLEKFIAEANETAKSLQQWIERVRVQLDGIMGIAGRPASLRTTGQVDALVGSLEREAEIRVEDEPGAASAHIVEGGLDGAHAQPYTSQAREIAQLIEKARKAKAGEEGTKLAKVSAR